MALMAVGRYLPFEIEGLVMQSFEAFKPWYIDARGGWLRIPCNLACQNGLVDANWKINCHVGGVVLN